MSLDLFIFSATRNDLTIHSAPIEAEFLTCVAVTASSVTSPATLDTATGCVSDWASLLILGQQHKLFIQLQVLLREYCSTALKDGPMQDLKTVCFWNSLTLASNFSCSWISIISVIFLHLIIF
jgi:hypothetical protein